MSNILFTPSRFINGNNLWDGTKYALSGAGTINLSLAAPSVQDDWIAGNFTNLAGVPVTVVIYINGVIAQEIAVGVEESVEIISDYIQPGQPVAISVVADSGTLSVEIFPSDSLPAAGPAESYVLKGFIEMPTMADNAVGEISVLGELSPKSTSYARERGQYTIENFKDVSLTSFKSVSKADGMIPVPYDVNYAALNLAQWIYDQSIDGTLPLETSTLVQNIYSQFADSGFTDIRVGEIVSEGQYKMPSWIAYSMIFNDGTEKATVKIWLADDAFRRQYDEYELVVVPAIENIDDFFADYNTVKGLVDDFNMPALTLAVEEAANGFPYTLLRTIMFDWVHETDEDLTIPVPWSVIIYGAAGNNIDVIKAKLREWILDNSERTREDWVALFPDIFRSTEHIIAPLWDNYSIPNRTLVAGLYSPVAEPGTVLSVIKACSPGYDAAHVEANAQTSVFMYKSLSFVTVGGPENRDEIYKFYGRFTDYIAVPTDSPDFNRMSPETQQWIMLITNMLRVAEEMTEYSDIPVGMTRLKRGNVLYVVASYADIQYLVVSKQFIESLAPVDTEAGV